MKEILKPCDLLNNNGELNAPGFSKSMLQVYDRKKIKANKLRIKEWDYYLIYNNHFGIALTVADNSYMGLLSASVLWFDDKKEKTNSVMTFFPLGKLNTNFNTNEKINMPSTTKNGNIMFKNKKCDFRFFNNGISRVLYCNFLNFLDDKNLEVNLTLTDEPKESVVVATPFKNKKTAFYYNQKIVGFKAHGTATLGDEKFTFKKEDSFALLDWGRGVWTYKNTWFWSSAIGTHNNKTFGFNLGYGFGSDDYATENMLFYDGVAHKLDKVVFEIPKNEKEKDDFLKPWKFTSNNNRLELTFTPILNRHADTNALILRSNQNQIFGKFDGFVVLDNNEKIEVENLLGFAEKVFNKW